MTSMKNKQIINSWNKIKPDNAANERMLAALISRNNSGQFAREKAYPMKKSLNWKWLAPIMTCLVLIVAFVGVFGNNAGWFGGRVYTTSIGDSGTLSFYKMDNMPGEASFAWDERWGKPVTRDFTAKDSKTLFGNLSVTGSATFRSADNAFMHLEGRAGNTKINLAANGHGINDHTIDAESERSIVNDIPVSAGYWLSDANSKGSRTIIYIASFEHNGTAVYLEAGGVETDKEALRTELGGIIDQLTQNPPNVSAVTAK